MSETRFDDLAGQLDYPMVVVTAAVGDHRAGCLAGYHTQCSIDPTRFLVCISRLNHTLTVATRGTHLAVHFLDQSNKDLEALFGEQTGDDVDKFTACAWHSWHGVPVLTDTKAWFIGRILDRLPLGDHVGHLLEPIEVGLAGQLSQLAFQQVKSMSPGHPA